MYQVKFRFVRKMYPTPCASAHSFITLLLLYVDKIKLGVSNGLNRHHDHKSKRLKLTFYGDKFCADL